MGHTDAPKKNVARNAALDTSTSCMTSMVTAPTRDALPTRYSLLSRLEHWDDHQSWKEFFETYWRLIYSVATKSGLTDAEAQDVVQETVICVAKDIHKFKRDRAAGSFKGWLRNITRWRIADQFKRRNYPGRREDGEPSGAALSLENIPESADNGMDSMWEAEWRANLFKAALDRVKRRVREEHYQIFDLYVLREWPVMKVVRTLGVSIGQVYLAKHRVAAMVKKELRALEHQPVN